MNNFEERIEKLSRLFLDNTFKFLKSEMDKDELYVDIKLLILSAHMSSLCTLLRRLSEMTKSEIEMKQSEIFRNKLHRFIQHKLRIEKLPFYWRVYYFMKNVFKRNVSK